MRVLVCGSRNWKDDKFIHEYLEVFNKNYHGYGEIDVLIHGGARGADTIAGEFAESNNIKVVKFSAEWKKYGKAAGPMRNNKMLTEGKPDIVIAFINKNQRSRGSKHMVRLAKKANIITVSAVSSKVWNGKININKNKQQYKLFEDG